MNRNDNEFVTRYSTNRRNRSYKGNAHLHIVQALKDRLKFKSLGMNDAELLLTTSQEPQFAKLQRTVEDEIILAHTTQNAHLNGDFVPFLNTPSAAPSHFKTPKSRAFPGATLFSSHKRTATAASTIEHLS